MCLSGYGNFRMYCRNFDDGDLRAGWGNFSYEPEDSDNSEALLDELNTLLTAGRLNPVSRQIIKKHVDAEEDPLQQIRIAQQLFAVTPEFHSTGLVDFNGEEAKRPDPIEPSTKPYKAVVYFMANGGLDSFNLIVPHTCASKDLYTEYRSVRGVVALNKNRILQINTSGSNQPCSVFGVHQDLPVLKSLYDTKELVSIIDNTRPQKRFLCVPDSFFCLHR